MSTNIGTLTIEMAANVAKLQADMDAAKRVVGDSMKSIEEAVGYAKKAFIAFAGVATVDAFAGMIRGSIDSAAAMGKLATQAGTTAEALSGLVAVGKLSGTSGDVVAGAMNKMTKAMSGAGEDAKGAGAALRALGVNFDDFVKQSPDQRMQTVAKAMDGFSDGAGKTAVAMALMGKSGAEMLPYMRDLAQVGDLQAKVTTEQANQARQFNLDLAKVKATSEGWKKELAMGMLPALSETSKAYVDVINRAGGLRDEIVKLSRDGTIADWTRNAVTGLTYLADVVQGLLSLFPMFGKAIAGVMASTATMVGAVFDAFQKMRDGNLSGAWDTLKGGVAGVKTVVAETAADISGLWNQKLWGEKFRERMAELKDMKAAAAAAKPEIDGNFNVSDKDAKAKVDPQIKAYADLVAAIREKIAANDLEALTGKKLTEAQTLDLQIKKDVEKGTISAAQAATLRASGLLEEVDASEKAKDASALLKKQMEEAAKAYADTVEAQQKYTDTLKAQVATQKQHYEEIGKTKDEIAALEAAKLEEQAASKDGLATIADQIDATGALSAHYREQAAALRELANLKKADAAKQTAVDAAKKAGEEWKKVTDQIDQAGTTAILDMFTKGTDAAKAFRDTLVAMFKTLVLRPIISFILNPISGAIGNMLGINTGSAAGVASGASNLWSLGSSAASMAGTYATTAYNAASGALLLGDAASAGAAATAAATAGGATAATAGAAAGAGSMVASAVPYVAAAVLAYQALSSMNGGETRVGGQYGVAYDGKVVNNRRDETYTRVGQQYNRDAGNTTGVTNGDAYLMEADGLGGAADKAIRTAVSATASSIDATLKDLGSSMRLGQFYAGLETSGEGRGGVMAGGTFADGTKFGSSGKGSNYDGTFYDKTFSTSPDMNTALADFSTELKQTTIQALQAAKDIPESAKNILKGVDAKALSDADATALLKKLTDQITAVKTFQAAIAALDIKTLGAVTYDAAAKITEALGGIENATKLLSNYWQNYYTDAERLAIQTKNVNKAFADLGLTMPTSRDEFRKLMESQDLSTEAGRKMYAALLNLADAFAAVTPSADAAAKATKDKAAADKAAADKAASDKAAADAAAKAQAQADAKAATDAAYAAVQRAVAAQQAIAQAAVTAANNAIASVNSVLGVLKSNIAGLMGETAASMTAAAGRAFIAAAVSTVQGGGKLPDSSNLGDAISAARAGLSSTNYASQYEADRDKRVLLGQLQALQGAAGDQLTEAQQQLQTAQDQLAALEKVLAQAKAEVDAVRGVDNSVQAVGTSVDALHATIKAEIEANKTTETTKPATATSSDTTGASPLFVVGGGGSGSGASSGSSGSTGASSLFVVGGTPTKAANNAGGGYFGGGWSWVGETGPELAYFGSPARIYTSAESQALAGNGDDGTSSETADANRRAEAAAQASLTARMVRLLERWEAGGMPATRSA